MGTAPISKLSTAQPEVPARPYKRNKPRRRGLFSLRKNYCEPRTLVQLILLQDWQKVLVRAKLYPHEISQFISTEINGTPLQILPLHLVCALDPPVAVVTLFLKLNPQATMAPVNAHHPKNTESNTSSRRRKNKGLRKFSSMKSITSGSTSPKPSLPHLFRQARRQRSEPSISIFEHSDDLAIAGELQEQSLLNRETVPSRKNVPRWGAYYKNFEPSDCEDSTSLRGKDSEEYPQPQPVQSDLESPSLVESFSSYSMASSSRQSASLLDHRGTILQLSPSGSVTPFPISSRETDSTSETYSQAPPTGKSSPLFDVRWDLTPLLGASVVSEKSPDNSILPIHICILYHASPAVVRAIVENNPAGAVASALGMLPIHMVSAGWRMEPIVPKLPPLPESIESDKNGSTAKGIPLQRYHCQQEHHPSRVKEILTILCKAIPDSTRIRSGQHGMTPAEYVAESMQGESQREECLRLLQPLDEDKDKEQPVEYCRLEGPLEKLTEMASTNPSHIFLDSHDASREVPWEIQCPSVSSFSELKMCKSISIHSLLLQKDWEGALSLAEDDPEQAKEWFFGVDDQLDPSIDEIPESECEVWKRLALHIACAYRAPVGLVEVLLHANPDGATSCDPRSGDLPIHLACQHKASYRVIKALLNHSPITTKAVNSRGHSPLHHAVLAKAHYAVIELLVQTDPESILATDQDEQTPLELARKAYGRNSIIVRLLEMVKLVLEKPTKQSTIGHHDTADF